MDLNKIMESIADVIDQKPSFTMWFVFKDGAKIDIRLANIVSTEKNQKSNQMQISKVFIDKLKDMCNTTDAMSLRKVSDLVAEKDTIFEYDYEFGVHKGLGYLKGNIIKFEEHDDLGNTYKIPHMGWNNIEIVNDKGILKDIPNNSYVYFVHSYHLDNPLKTCVSAYANYGVKYGAVVEYKNIHATQFHPEKSGEVGLKILKNFGEL